MENNLENIKIKYKNLKDKYENLKIKYENLCEYRKKVEKIFEKESENRDATTLFDNYVKIHNEYMKESKEHILEMEKIEKEFDDYTKQSNSK